MGVMGRRTWLKGALTGLAVGPVVASGVLGPVSASPSRPARVEPTDGQGTPSESPSETYSCSLSASCSWADEE